MLPQYNTNYGCNRLYTLVIGVLLRGLLRSLSLIGNGTNTRLLTSGPGRTIPPPTKHFSTAHTAYRRKVFGYAFTWKVVTLDLEERRPCVGVIDLPLSVSLLADFPLQRKAVRFFLRPDFIASRFFFCQIPTKCVTGSDPGPRSRRGTAKQPKNSSKFWKFPIEKNKIDGQLRFNVQGLGPWSNRGPMLPKISEPRMNEAGGTAKRPTSFSKFSR